MASKVDKILVAVDLSDCAMEAVQFGHSLASSMGVTLDVVHVWDYRTVYARAMSSSGEPEQIVQATEAEARARLNAFCQDARDHGITIHNAWLRSGQPADEVVKLAVIDDYHLIVAGTAGRRGVPRLFLGSVAESIIRRAPCPVVTVRAPSKA